jgi:hypothetical protein
VSVADLFIRLLQLVQWVFPAELVNLIIDDTLVSRCAKTGPGISIKHDHSHKANRPSFLNSQCWVTLARSCESGWIQRWRYRFAPGWSKSLANAVSFGWRGS